MKLLIDALGASAGGGLTYLWNVLPLLAQKPEIETSVLADRSAGLSSSGNVTILDCPANQGSLQRFRWEQTQIPKLVRENGCDVLLCTGNFALWNSPVPQILLSRNALYTSTAFEVDLRRRGDYRLWLDTKIKGALAKASIRRADVTVAPSAAFAKKLMQWTARTFSPSTMA